MSFTLGLAPFLLLLLKRCFGNEIIDRGGESFLVIILLGENKSWQCPAKPSPPPCSVFPKETCKWSPVANVPRVYGRVDRITMACGGALRWVLWVYFISRGEITQWWELKVQKGTGMRRNLKMFSKQVFVALLQGRQRKNQKRGRSANLLSPDSLWGHSACLVWGAVFPHLMISRSSWASVSPHSAERRPRISFRARKGRGYVSQALTCVLRLRNKSLCSFHGW